MMERIKKINHHCWCLFAGENIALGKTTRQSSVYFGNGVIYNSDKAVDGNVNSNFDAGSCTNTKPISSGMVDGGLRESNEYYSCVHYECSGQIR